MSKVLLLAFVLLYAAILFAPAAYAAQYYPQPPNNCGAPWTDAKAPDLNELHERGALEKYACCYSKYKDTLLNFGNNVGVGGYNVGLEGLPIIGSVIKATRAVFNAIIVYAPGSIWKMEGIPNINEYLAINVDVCTAGAGPVNDPSTDTCFCKQDVSPALTSIATYCANIDKPNEVVDCLNCLGITRLDAERIVRQVTVAGKPLALNLGAITHVSYSPEGGGVWTGIGCVKADIKGFIEKTVFGLGVGIAGAVSLLCIIYASLRMQLSRGKPEEIKKAQELLTSCIMGLVLIIFAIFLLRIIGVDILRIPGFE